MERGEHAYTQDVMERTNKPRDRESDRQTGIRTDCQSFSQSVSETDRQIHSKDMQTHSSLASKPRQLCFPAMQFLWLPCVTSKTETGSNIIHNKRSKTKQMTTTMTRLQVACRLACTFRNIAMSLCEIIQPRVTRTEVSNEGQRNEE